MNQAPFIVLVSLSPTAKLRLGHIHIPDHSRAKRNEFRQVILFKERQKLHTRFALTLCGNLPCYPMSTEDPEDLSIPSNNFHAPILVNTNSFLVLLFLVLLTFLFSLCPVGISLGPFFT